MAQAIYDELDEKLGAYVDKICAAVGYYAEKYQKKFQPAVVTNAKNFTSGAIELAEKNGVRLIARRELENLFFVNKIPRC